MVSELLRPHHYKKQTYWEELSVSVTLLPAAKRCACWFSGLVLSFLQGGDGVHWIYSHVSFLSVCFVLHIFFLSFPVFLNYISWLHNNNMFPKVRAVWEGVLRVLSPLFTPLQPRISLPPGGNQLCCLLVDRSLPFLVSRPTHTSCSGLCQWTPGFLVTPGKANPGAAAASEGWLFGAEEEMWKRRESLWKAIYNCGKCQKGELYSTMRASQEDGVALPWASHV